MNQAIDLPNIGDHFRNAENTELYKVTLAGKSMIWVEVLDFNNNRRFSNRPYSTIVFIKEMIPVANAVIPYYGKEKRAVIQEFVEQVLNF